jgi:RNA polymerase sigma factor (TIGR02999 family)
MASFSPTDSMNAVAAADPPAAAHEEAALLGRERQGESIDELMTCVYDDLHRLAERTLAGERPGQTLQPTALVHEAYLRLAGSQQDWQGRAHFFGAAARAIRRILLDRARARHCERRGGALGKLPLEAAAELASGEPEFDLLALDEALERLARVDAVPARVVELRFFGGLGVAETAEVLGTSASTVERDWRFARAWLHRELGSAMGGP